MGTNTQGIESLKEELDKIKHNVLKEANRIKNTVEMDWDRIVDAVYLERLIRFNEEAKAAKLVLTAIHKFEDKPHSSLIEYLEYEFNLRLNNSESSQQMLRVLGNSLTHLRAL